MSALKVAKEEVLFTMFDTGWEEDLPVTLITYSDGSMDLHSQTGPDFRARMEKAVEILKSRGLTLKTDSPEFIGGSGAYVPVVLK